MRQAQVPEALQTRPRARPEWMLSPFWYHFIALLIAGGALALGVGALEATTELHAGQGPPAGTGTVVRAETVRGYRARHGSVTFTRGEQTSRCEIHLDDVPRLHPGDQLPYWEIEGYVTRDFLLEPCARLAAQKAPTHLGILSALGALTLAAAALVFVSERRRYRLFTDGAGAVGTVAGVFKRGGKGGASYVVEYEVAGPPAFRGKRTLARRRYAQMTAGSGEPRPGDTVHVVYDPDNPKRSEL